MQRVQLYATPASLVVLSVVGIIELASARAGPLNDFDQTAIACLIAGGILAFGILGWNAFLLRISKDPRKRALISISAAVFGLILISGYTPLLVIELVNSNETGAYAKTIAILFTSLQLLIIVAWVVPLLLQSWRTIKMIKPRNREAVR